ncbi:MULTISPECIES: peptidylprolyl isomerase [unclassified Tolypothrix]|uniref:peptidylprolyl isomerase n=1 Tax=unclassified Tolypothrix TaxID=2649714 RepID=UPI0005EABD6B|nr:MULTISPECIES: peptidylprolyl isomerase [unclassified Tolypothrix]BAY93218.1 PpiC-type peptidyl-prolyl cis-trans isomerase [Microchaete diplosiphon NIES-3275]EKF00236.1 putative peptidylprolyl isomerase [Tolypothrix sp. PCC 7601]MBE9085731.1 peptidylprolyl isomerase [Tolypothrix sp. LEGE 11397]UYD27092.1 peptidylprolyl isomerase [Tolypothrix sp. PCC 7712]UYD37048.1 peptidylprolyl isomerase [Tolypothrix sp. PCC 7601]
MESLSFLTVDRQSISIEQAVKYLQASGKLSQFIGDIIRQYVIEQEINTRDDIEINPALTEQTIIDFRLKNQLTDPQIFQEWLKKNGTDYATFHASAAYNFKLEKLKALVTEPKLPEYFIERKIYLDRVVLSRIFVDNRELCEELLTQIEEGGSFEQLAKEYSLAEDRIVNGMMGPISRGTLPDKIRAAIDAAVPGELIGPIELEERYGLFRLEQFLPASLEDTQLKQVLQNELFEKWLAEKIQKLTVKLQVK